MSDETSTFPWPCPRCGEPIPCPVNDTKIRSIQAEGRKPAMVETVMWDAFKDAVLAHEEADLDGHSICLEHGHWLQEWISL